MNLTKTIPLLVLCAAAAVPAAANAGVERGAYTGKTTQPAPTKYSGAMKVSLGILSNPARVTRVELTARLACEDGSTKDVRYGKVIAFGPKLNGKGRFVYVDGGLRVKGRIGGKGKASGTFSYAVEGCAIEGVSWSAKA